MSFLFTYLTMSECLETFLDLAAVRTNHIRPPYLQC